MRDYQVVLLVSVPPVKVREMGEVAPTSLAEIGVCEAR